MKYEIKRVCDECHTCFLDLWNEKEKINIELTLNDCYKNFKTSHKKIVDIFKSICTLGFKISTEDIELMFMASKNSLDFEFTVDLHTLEFNVNKKCFNGYFGKLV